MKAFVCTDEELQLRDTPRCSSVIFHYVIPRTFLNNHTSSSLQHLAKNAGTFARFIRVILHSAFYFRMIFFSFLGVISSGHSLLENARKLQVTELTNRIY